MYLLERFVEKIKSLIIAREDCFQGGPLQMRKVVFPSVFCFFDIPWCLFLIGKAHDAVHLFVLYLLHSICSLLEEEAISKIYGTYKQERGKEECYLETTTMRLQESERRVKNAIESKRREKNPSSE